MVSLLQSYLIVIQRVGSRFLLWLNESADTLCFVMQSNLIVVKQLWRQAMLSMLQSALIVDQRLESFYVAPREL